MTEKEIKNGAPSGAKFYHTDICGGVNYIANIDGRACIYIGFQDGLHEWQPMCHEVIQDVKYGLKPL